MAHRLGRYLRKRGFIDADDLETPSSPLMGWYAGLLSEPAGYADVDDAGGAEGRRFGARRRWAGEAQGSSVHAEVTVAAHDAAGRERLCRYASRPPLADAQPSMTRDGRVAVQLRGWRRGGAGQVVLEEGIVPGSSRHRVPAGALCWRARGARGAAGAGGAGGRDRGLCRGRGPGFVLPRDAGAPAQRGVDCVARAAAPDLRRRRVGVRPVR